ncbi:MAG: NADH-quinone oxidoreductase subunit J [Anaerolineales bacterium]
MTADWIAFASLALIATVTAVMMIVSRHAIYSALYLVLNFATIAVFYLLLSAPFIAMVQITVYTGAIMVLFLFVIMLLGVERVGTTPSLPYQGPLAIGLGLALFLLLGYGLISSGESTGAALSALTNGGFGSPTSIGELLFDQYLIPFEVTSVLLLVAMVGAILLTGKSRRMRG